MKINRNKIEVWMARRGMSQGDLAKAYGSHQTAVSYLMRRAGAGLDINPATAAKLADALGVAVDSILEVE